MAIVNENFLKLPGSYLFSDIAKKVNAFKIAHPEAKLIRLGIGDVTRPLPSACIEAMHRAVDEMAHAETFRGYGPEQGYDFLIEAIIANDFAPRGVQLKASEVFVSDGAKSDTGNIGDILQGCNSVAVTDPVYPVYIDSNVMSGRAGDLQEDGRWSRITYLPCTAENGFIPQIPDIRMDMVYLCYPNNPTGTTLTKEQLKQWVDYALANDSLILFDAAYEAFIRRRRQAMCHRVPQLLEDCRIHRCTLWVYGSTGRSHGSDKQRRTCFAEQTVEPSPVYQVQRAEAIYSPEGKKQVKETIDYYLENARIMREGFQQAGFQVFGGVNSPYLWLKTPQDCTSWQFFDRLLNDVHVVGTPGVGFGPSGEGYLRLTAFGKREDCIEAMKRIAKWAK